MKTFVVATAGVLAVVLSGCFSTRNEAVQVRREQELLDARRESDAKAFDVLLEERMAAREAARLPRELEASNARLAAAREAIARIKRTPGDPWRSYEEERRAHFYRPWADVGRALPPLEPDTDGPPGWIGPKLPEATVDPNALPAEEERPDDGGAPAGGQDGGWDDWGGGDDGGEQGGDDGGWGGGDDGGDDGGWGDSGGW